MNSYDAPIYHLSGALRGTTLSEVWIDGGIVHHLLPRGAERRHITEIQGYVYPGLLDAHTHPGVSREPQQVVDSEIEERLRICRSFGVTAIRDCGGQRNPNEIRAERHLREHDASWQCSSFSKDSAPTDILSKGRGLPKVIHCGQHIARYKRYIRYMAVDVEPSQLPEEAVRQAQRSDGWIKIIGDWIDRSRGADADLAPLWPREVLIDAITAAHEAGARVAVHSFARETIDDLLEAGVDSIEHGTGMTQDHMNEAAARGIIVDPTIRQVLRFPEFAAAAGTKYPVYRDRMLTMHSERRQHIAMLAESGVDLVMGSDTSTVEELCERGLPYELMMAVEYGMNPTAAMAAASYAGRSCLGFTSWEDGACADFVVYSDDPETDISRVLTPQCVLIDGALA